MCNQDPKEIMYSQPSSFSGIFDYIFFAKETRFRGDIKSSTSFRWKFHFAVFVLLTFKEFYNWNIFHIISSEFHFTKIVLKHWKAVVVSTLWNIN